MTYKIIVPNGETINTIVADEEFVKAYTAENGWTYEAIPEPEPQPAEQPQPSVEDDLVDIILNHEERLALMDLA